MATTIDRSGITPTNDTGTPASPNGDGTLINAAWWALVYDEIDALFATDPFVFGGKLQVDGFGTHAFSSGGSGSNIINVRNTSAGTGNSASVKIGNNSAADLSGIYAFSSTYSTSGYNVASGSLFEGKGSGGLHIAASDTSGVVKIYTGGANERGRWESNGRFGHGGVAPDTASWFQVAGSFTPASGTAIGLSVIPTLAVPAGSPGHGFRVSCELQEAGSGTHGVLSGATFEAPTITSGAASTTLGTAVYISGAPSGAASNYALYVAAGTSYFVGPLAVADGSAGAPALTFASDTDTGFYRTSSNEIGVAAGGVLGYEFATIGTSASRAFFMPAQAFGTGGVSGCGIYIGRNSSGSGAAGFINLEMASGSQRFLWVDATGDLEIHTAAPTDSGGDTSGTVVGDQSSTRSTKEDIRAYEDHRAALELIQRTPLYRFRYRTTDRETEHVGIIAEESPEFTRRNGKSFDPINAFGYTAAAVKALLDRVETLEAALAARG